MIEPRSVSVAIRDLFIFPAQVSSRPHIRILEPLMHNYEEVSNDALSIRGFQEYRCNDYHLEYVAEDVLYYIVSPKDVVLAKMRDEDDHVDWLLAHDKYEEALETVQAHVKELKRHNYQDISREYIKYLVEEGFYDEAALQCSKSLKTRPQWEEQVYTFARIGQLKIIAPYLPKGERGRKGNFKSIVVVVLVLVGYGVSRE